MQVWRQTDRNRDKSNRTVYGMVYYGISKYGSNINISVKEEDYNKCRKNKYAPAFEMKTGLMIQTIYQIITKN